MTTSKPFIAGDFLSEDNLSFEGLQETILLSNWGEIIVKIQRDSFDGFSDEHIKIIRPQKFGLLTYIFVLSPF